MGFMTRRVVGQVLGKVDTGRKDWSTKAGQPLVDAMDIAIALRRSGKKPFGTLGSGILENIMRKKMEHVKEQFGQEQGLLQKAISTVNKMHKAMIAHAFASVLAGAGVLLTMALYDASIMGLNVAPAIPESYGWGIVAAATLYLLHPLYVGIKDARLNTLANVLKKAGES
ncbi:MAG: hypothetical protein PHV13_02090 [Candidatus ainarchaeum sp.]|nr:hypothetical protein [Candidatus ainarchaeum sp.]